MLPVLQTAIAHHQAGRLDEAERLYRHVLAASPEHADALHLLGVVAHQRGQHRDAIDLIQHALRIAPATAAYHLNLSEAFRAIGDLAQAVAHGRSALLVEPANADAHHNLGLALRQQGDGEAVAHFEAAIERRPHWQPPYLALGDFLRESGRQYEAMAVYREGVRLVAEPAALLEALARLLLQTGYPEEALIHSQEAVRLRPNDPAALTVCGDALAAFGRWQEARGWYEKAVGLAPAFASGYHGMGRLLQAQSKFDEALPWHAEAVRLNPADASFHCDRAGTLYDLERYEEAVEAFRLAIQCQPRSAEAHNYLGYVLQDQGEFPQALAAYREAIRLRPDYADAFLNLGILYSEMGEAEQALAAYREALRLDPTHPEALSALALALRDAFPDEQIAACERLLAEGGAPGRRLAVLRYGLAQALDARGAFGRAAEHARQANVWFRDEARARQQAYDPAEHRRYVDQIIEAFTPEHFQRVRGWGVETEVPVFVLGLPRSGTSLVEQILASHPRVFGAGELALVRTAYRSLPGRVGRTAPGIKCIDALDRPLVRSLAEEYLAAVRRLAPQAERIVDKMPDNYLMLGLIATLLPQARIIHTRRDVRDVGLSCWMTHFKHIRWACDLTHVAERIREYQRLMVHWRRVLPSPMLEIDYEDVVGDLEGSARRLVAWCGLEWDGACLAFHQTKRVVRTASMTQVREPVYRRSLQRWKHYQEALGPLLDVLSKCEAG
jgi:tetratricopeptide (TPR) repeat protein